MQKYLRVVICTLLFFVVSCQGKDEKNIPAKISQPDQVPFFPVTDFLLGQLNEIEKLPVTPVQINLSGDKQDSAWLKREDIRKFASPFLHPVIDSVSMEKYFGGKSFLDQTINSFTFSYDPISKLPDSIKITHWDVYVDPEKNEVQRIYIVKAYSSVAGNTTTQLTWQSNKWFSIRTIIQAAGKEPVVKEEMLKWDFNE